MMTTEAQLRANQENAKKSTGPVTFEGKKRSSQNAMTHGIFASIPILPGEDEASLKALADALNQAFQPKDAMELMLVERIIIASIRQIRLREAEAAHIRISMTPKKIAAGLNQALNIPFLEQLTPEDLTPETEATFQYFLAALDEIEGTDYVNTPLSIETIKKTMSLIFGLLEGKPRDYKMTWADFIKNPDMIRKGISDIKFDLEKIIKACKTKHTAYHLLEDIKALHRIPQLKDMALFNKYQTQFDNDLYRAMNALDKYRNAKVKIIEGEIIDELAA